MGADAGMVCQVFVFFSNWDGDPPPGVGALRKLRTLCLESIVWVFSINCSHSVRLYHAALLCPLFGHSQAHNAAIIAYFMPSWLRVREARAFSL